MTPHPFPAISNAANTEPRVLLVEDDPLVARAVTRFLRAHAIDVVLAVNATEITRLEGQFDLGVFDIDLPDANGIDLAAQCSAMGLLNGIIFFTGTQNEGRLAAARRLGELIDKSEGIGELIEHVLSVCKRTSGVYGPSARR